MALERTALGQITWYHHFQDIYYDQDFSPMQFAAELVLLARRPKSIQYVTKTADLTINGSQTLTSVLPISVSPTRARAILNIQIQNANKGHLSINPRVTATTTLTWNIVAQGQGRTRTLRAVVIDP